MSETKQKNVKYRYHVIRENCRALFNVSTSTFDGATNNLDKNDEYDIDDIKKQINNWLKQEVK